MEVTLRLDLSWMFTAGNLAPLYMSDIQIIA